MTSHPGFGRGLWQDDEYSRDFSSSLGRKWWRNIPRAGCGTRTGEDSAGTKMNFPGGRKEPERRGFTNELGFVSSFQKDVCHLGGNGFKGATQKYSFCSIPCPCRAPTSAQLQRVFLVLTERDFAVLLGAVQEAQTGTELERDEDEEGSGIPRLMSSCARDAFSFNSATPRIFIFPILPLDPCSFFPTRHRAGAAAPANP